MCVGGLVCVPAAKSQLSLPVGAVGCPTCHRTQQVRVDLNHFLHCLRGNPRPSSGSRINSHYHSVLELERQSRGPVSKFYLNSIRTRRETLQKLHRLCRRTVCKSSVLIIAHQPRFQGERRSCGDRQPSQTGR